MILNNTNKIFILAHSKTFSHCCNWEQNLEQLAGTHMLLHKLHVLYLHSLSKNDTRVILNIVYKSTGMKLNMW